jgi:hypothetical protein
MNGLQNVNGQLLDTSQFQLNNNNGMLISSLVNN